METCRIVEGFQPRTLVTKREQFIQEKNGFYKKMQPYKRGEWIYWSFPPPGKLKLNFDASWKPQIAQVGGTIRNSCEDIMLAYHINSTAANVIHAEAKSLLYGFLICNCLKISIDII